MSIHSRTWCTALAAWGFTALVLSGCNPLAPTAPVGPDGEPIAMADIARVQLDPDIEDDDARLQALQNLGLSETLALYFLGNDVTELLDADSVFTASFNSSLDLPTVTVGNSSASTARVVLKALSSGTVVSAELASGESQTWTLPAGQYAYFAFPASSDSVTRAGRQIFGAGFAYNWSYGGL